jgi:putative two-component system response regulator
MKTVVIVDDNDVNLLMAERALRGLYRVYTLPSAGALFNLLEKVRPDLILLDILMPEVGGFEAMERLKTDARYAGIPVVFLTSKSDAVTEVRGFELGAVDFISKPFSAPVLQNRIKTHLNIEAIIRERTLALEQQTQTLRRMQNSLVFVLANMVENRDKLTGKHIEHTTRYISLLLGAMLDKGVYADEVNAWIAGPGGRESTGLDVIISSSRLHDIGKVAVPDAILNKPDSLTDEEYKLMKTHVEAGEKIIENIINEAGEDIFLRNALLFAAHHHERWDGAGYPRGLKGADIPLQGRVMALADVYDALTSVRSYKSARTHEETVETIRSGAGTHFDPALVEVFLSVSEHFKDV